MATGNAPILGNVANHPKAMVQALLGRPTMLCDETPDTVNAVAKELARKGYREQLRTLADSAGLDPVRRAALVKAACGYGTVH